MAQSLKVKPLTRYKTPRYPAYSDPNPLDHPEALPYPFSQRLLDWALAVGLLGAGACQSDKDPGPVVIGNTFTFDKMGLPYQSPGFGTGLPDHLSAKETREVALRICQEEGLVVQKNVAWKDSVSGEAFLVDFFDPQQRIGVAVLEAWGEQPNTDRASTIQSGFGHPSWQYESGSFDKWWKAWRSIQNERSASEIHEWLDLKKRASWTADEKRLYDLFQRAAFSEVPDDEQWFFYRLYLEKNYGAPAQPLLYDRPAVEKAILDKSEDNLELALDEQDFLEQIFFLRKKEDWNPDVLFQYRNSFRIWWRDMWKFSAAMREIKERLHEGGNDTPEELAALRKSAHDFFATYDTKWREELPKILAPFDASRFSLGELKHLDEWAEQKKVFIAAISFQDKRYDYRYTVEEVNTYYSEADSVRLGEYKSLTKEAALKRLEDNLRMYIRWAKYQGRY